MEYIRNRYGVPAKRGALIVFKGAVCKILSARNGRLRVEEAFSHRRFYIHPTWEVVYEN